MKYFFILLTFLLVNCSKTDNETQRNHPMAKETPTEMAPLTAEEQNIVNKLNLEDIAKIDSELLINSTKYRQKTAMLIAYTMSTLKQSYSDIPAAFYLDRIIKLVDDKKLQAYGNLKLVRFSEVKLTKK